MIGLVDYGAGNLRSVCNALDHLGRKYKLGASPRDMDGTDAILLPGVGHFGQMMGRLEERGLVSWLRDRAAEGVPLLGICLGMQALFETSEEAPDLQGLGLLPGAVLRFSGVPRVPHMGWNDVQFRDGTCESFYFANSFYAPVGEWTSATAHYGRDFTAAIMRDNIAGFQFHPEKSGPPGLDLLNDWCRSC